MALMRSSKIASLLAVLATSLCFVLASCSPAEEPNTPSTPATSAASPPAVSPSPSPSESDQAAPLIGTWTAQWSDEELLEAPEADPDDFTDINWGTFTLTLAPDGTGTESIENVNDSFSSPITYTVEGDVLSIERAKGGQFVVRWSISDGQLLLERDPELGKAPITYVIMPLDPVER